jgi:hypothetical protein
MIKLSLCLATLVLLILSITACSAVGKAQLVGKWEATVTHKRSGNETKMLWEFLSDGTFTAAPIADPAMFVDKDKYEVLDEGKSVKINSQLLDYVTCTAEGNTMSGETPEAVVKFRKL